MIVIQQVGRLGNSMFQFAFGFAMSKKLKTNFIFNTSYLEEYFELGDYNSPIKKVLRTFMYRLSLKFSTYTSVDFNQFVHPESIINQAKNNQVVYGYFQSEFFFEGHREEIIKLFKFNKKKIAEYGKNHDKILEGESVCIAIRLTDYLTWKIEEINNVTPELTWKYFIKVLDSIPGIEKKNIFFISDDIATVKNTFSYSADAIFIEDPFEQLYCLQHAKHIIISNSTFQWWGAWLNQRKDKVVYAPKYWLGHKVKIEYPAKIIPDDWIQIEVD